MEAFLIHIGINPADVFAAFTGGVCASFATQGSRPTLIGVISSIIVGTGVGAYGGPVLPTYIGLKPSGFMSFIIGASGLPVLIACRGAVIKAMKLRFSLSERKLDPGE